MKMRILKKLDIKTKNSLLKNSVLYLNVIKSTNAKKIYVISIYICSLNLKKKISFLMFTENITW